MRILGLDTATEACSAAIWLDGQTLYKEAEVERGHADLILQMVDELLAEAGVRLAALDAIAFGRGPGSFTGVRLAASVTQGLAFGADLPVVAVSDLQALAQQLVREPMNSLTASLSAVSAPGASRAVCRALVCSDARMQEVYWACFEQGPEGLMAPIGDEHVSSPEDVRVPAAWAGTPIRGIGRGFSAYQGLRATLAPMLASLDDRSLPSAREIVVLAQAEARAGRTTAPWDVAPVYLRDDVARPQS